MNLFGNGNAGNYYQTYIKKDGKYISLEEDTKEFCGKWLRPIHPENWDWTTRDFEKEELKPSIEEARAIGIMVYDDLSKKKTQVNLQSINNSEALMAFFNPDGKYFEMNMKEFAYALDVELEHGKVRDANVTNNHPFLTAMVVLAHMSESLTYYRRLKVMETEAEIFEIERKLKDKMFFTDNLKNKLEQKRSDLQTAKNELEQRLAMMDEYPVMDSVE